MRKPNYHIPDDDGTKSGSDEREAVDSCVTETGWDEGRPNRPEDANFSSDRFQSLATVPAAWPFKKEESTRTEAKDHGLRRQNPEALESGRTISITG